MLCPLHRDSKLPTETPEPQKQSSKRRVSKELSPGFSAGVSPNKSNREWNLPSGSPCKWILACSSLSIEEKEPRLFNGMKFYLSGDYTMSYRGFIQDLIITAGGVVLQRKPVSRHQQRVLDDSSELLIIYSSTEHSEKQQKSSGDNKILEAKNLADASGGQVASSEWIIDSIAACKLQPLAQG